MHASSSMSVMPPSIRQNEANANWPNEANAKSFALKPPPGILAEQSQ
jgi:hypothetical protein